MEASTAKRMLLILSGAMAAGVCGFALYRLIALLLSHGQVDRTRLAVFAVVLIAGFAMGLLSLVAGIKSK